MKSKTNSFLARNEILAACAVVAAHSSAQGAFFKQKDVFFLFNLFNNWCQSGLWADTDKFQNTQLARYLEDLVAEGYLRKKKNGSRPEYRLSRVGVLEAIYRITNKPTVPPEQFFFLLNFISSYRDRLIALVTAESDVFPPAVRLELATMLDLNELLAKEIKRVRTLIERLEIRIADSCSTHKLASGMIKRGLPLKEVVLSIQKEFPYELNNQRPLSELIGSIPVDQQFFELSDGALLRQQNIWQPMLKLLEEYKAELLRIKSQVSKGAF